MKDLHFNDKEAQVYNEIVRIANYINEKREKGWLLINPEGEVSNFNGMAFQTNLRDQCVAFKLSETCYSVLVEYKETHWHGKDTFLQEYKAALKHLKKYKLWEPKKIHNL